LLEVDRKKILSPFEKIYVFEIQQYLTEQIVLLFDFDEGENRSTDVNEQIPLALRERVFGLGVLSKLKHLKVVLSKSFGENGEVLAKDCSDNTNDLRECELPKHD